MGVALEIADQAATAGLGGIIGMMTGNWNDERQLRQQRELQNMQEAGNKRMMDYQMMKQLEMWKNTSYGPQKEQMKAAGINPALMYGMGGGGGQSTGNASGSVSAATAQQNPGEMGMGIQNAMQLALLKAQKENIEADTANKRADIPVKGAQVPNIEANTANTKIQTEIAKLDQQLKQGTLEENIQIATATMAKLQQEVLQQEVKTNVDRATQNTQIDQIRANLVGTLLTNEMTKAQTRTEWGKPALIRQQIASMKQDLINVTLARMQKWREIEISGQNANTTEREKVNELTHDLQEEMNAPFEVIEKVVQAIILKNVIAPDGKAPIRGFHNR